MIENEKTVSPLIEILLELFGTARILTGKRSVKILISERAGVRDVVEALARTCPELIGKVIVEDKSSLESSYILNVNGTSFVYGKYLCLKQGDRLLLFSSQSGG